MRIRLLGRDRIRMVFMAILGLSFWGCASKKIDGLEANTANPFDYSQTNISSILEFANRFALSDDDQARICAELQRQATETQTISSGVVLHIAAAQLFLPSCANVPPVHDRLTALSQDESAPPDQRAFATMSLRLSGQSSAKAPRPPTRKAKSRKGASASGAKVTSGDRFANNPEESAPPKGESSRSTAAETNAMARKKLEALRNLEKAMDRVPTP